MNFTKWMHWSERKTLEGISNPGVYAIAIRESDLSGTSYSLLKEIVYFGMTNAKGGLKSRLRKFEATIKGKRGHGGAARFRHKHKKPSKLVPLLYVAVLPFECDVSSNAPKDLRIMGEVAKCEYDCFARYVEKHGMLPEFNDKQKSKKK